ncbi:MAG TPA: amidohydrolase family protein [Baekduia sp.]|nr:amidohydrolase family protein [Baekduia sp.]
MTTEMTDVAAQTTTPRVDVHAHLMPTAAFDALPEGLEAVPDAARGEIALRVAARDGAVGRGAPEALREVGVHRERQRDRGVDISLTGPWIDMVKAATDAATQAAWCSAINRALAAATRGCGHTRFLAALPDLDGAAAADALDEALELGAVGGMLSANPSVGTLARGDLDALWSAAERRRAPLVLHPGEFSPPSRLAEHFMVNLVGNPFETTLAVGSLIGAEVPERFPGLDLVLVHGGGFFPYQVGRFDHGFRNAPQLRGYGGRPPREYLMWFRYDTVLFDDEPTRYLLDLVGPDRVLAGSDCPFAMHDHRPFEVPSCLGLAPAEVERVVGGNAVELFGLDVTGAETPGA